jgi:hypothetical protein
MRIRNPGCKKFESGIRDGKNSDPGSRMEKIRIRDKHPRIRNAEIYTLSLLAREKTFTCPPAAVAVPPVGGSEREPPRPYQLHLAQRAQLPQSQPRHLASRQELRISAGSWRGGRHSALSLPPSAAFPQV